MRIWCECIKRLHSKKVYESPFNSLENSVYSYSKVYLGARAVVSIFPKNIILQVSYSVRDGILITIKKADPYRILFDYVDGAYYTNDDSEREYNHLIERLSILNSQAKKLHYMIIFNKLETLLFEFINHSKTGDGLREP